jgi:uncharacterized protein (TIGR02217 family)
MAFHDVRFPVNISRGCSGGPSYRTTIIATAAGYEQRVAEWDESLMRWNVGHQVWDRARLDQLLEFFHARQGRAFAFRFQDPADYWVGMSVSGGVLTHNAPAAVPQFATGNGSQTTFPLTKLYVSGGVTRTRRITRPVAGTVRVWFGTTEQTTGWVLNPNIGTLTFTTPPANGTVIRWAGQFDVPARFDTDRMELDLDRLQLGEWPSIPIVGIRESDVDGFLPSDFGSLVRWYDASDLSTLFQDDLFATPVTAGGQTVGGWRDKSGNARDIVQATAARRPAYRSAFLSGRPAVEGDGVDDFLRSIGTFVTAQPYTVVMISRLATVLPTQVWYDATPGAVAAQQSINSSTLNSINAGVSLVGAAPDVAAHQQVAVFDGASSLMITDGTTVASGNTGANAMTGFTLLGNRSSSSGAWIAGGVSEIMVYSRRLTVSELAQIRAYSQRKWATP